MSAIPRWNPCSKVARNNSASTWISTQAEVGAATSLSHGLGRGRGVEFIAEDGGSEERKTKNPTSKRIIALHEVFTEVGFIDYAKSRRAADWMFPAAFYHGKERVADPARAASKRMNRMLQDVGIHKPMERVFHSTRHTAKEIMRLARVDDRTNDLQRGHAFKTVSRGYGAKDLEELPTEIEVLTALPLPEGLNIGPCLDRHNTKKTWQE